MKSKKTRDFSGHNKTLFFLLAQYGSPVVEVKAIYSTLGYTTPEAAFKAIRAYTFPVPTFRPHDSQKSRVMVMLEDVAEHLDKCRDEAEWNIRRVRNLV